MFKQQLICSQKNIIQCEFDKTKLLLNIKKERDANYWKSIPLKSILCDDLTSSLLYIIILNRSILQFVYLY